MQITVIGLKPDQERRIEREFTALDFSFISSTAYKQTLPMPDGDSVILMTRFVSHNQQKAVREHPGLVYVNGGLSSLREALKTISGT